MSKTIAFQTFLGSVALALLFALPVQAAERENGWLRLPPAAKRAATVASTPTATERHPGEHLLDALNANSNFKRAVAHAVTTAAPALKALEATAAQYGFVQERAKNALKHFTVAKAEGDPASILRNLKQTLVDVGSNAQLTPEVLEAIRVANAAEKTLTPKQAADKQQTIERDRLEDRELWSIKDVDNFLFPSETPNLKNRRKKRSQSL